MKLPYRFGRYQLEEKIAQGGMAEVFRARYSGASGFSKTVCVKRLLPIWSRETHFIQSLIDEAKLLAYLNHPNIVQVFELGQDQETFFVSMEYIDGVDLRSLWQAMVERETRLPQKFVIYILLEILKALRFAHRRKNEQDEPLRLVHRDISPQNILLSFDGEVKVADFGIAKGKHRSQETTQHSIKGKYSYMSPEQARGDVLDEQSDLFSAGILLYELLAGQKLFSGENDLIVLEQARQAIVPTKPLASCPEALRRVVWQALQRDLSERYADAHQFYCDLQKIASEEKMETAAEEFGEFLREIFPRIEGVVPNRALSMIDETKDSLPPIACLSRGKSDWIRWLLLPLCLMGLYFVGPFQPRMSVAVAPLKPSSLRVAVDPWGEVTIPRVMESQESPALAHNLSPGEYELKVYFPPKNQWARGTITLASGTAHHCFASFRDKPTLSCK